MLHTYRSILIGIALGALTACGVKQKDKALEPSFLTLEECMKSPDMYVGKDTLVVGKVKGVCKYDSCSLMLECETGDPNTPPIRLTPCCGHSLDTTYAGKLVLAKGKLTRVEIDSLALVRLENGLASIADEKENARQKKIIDKYKRIYKENLMRGVHSYTLYALVTDSIENYERKAQKISL